MMQIVEGMDVVNKIGKVKCDRNDNPVKPVQMISVTVA
jgi:cyclophilin family peptidyl-prolyl cis-trans isomerase